MPNNPFFRRAQTEYQPSSNKISRNRVISGTIAVTSKLASSAELGSPSGGPASTKAALTPNAELPFWKLGGDGFE